MKKLIFIFIALFLFIPIINAKEVTIYLFHSNTCPHCKSEKEFLSTLENVEVKYYEVGTYSKLDSKVRNKLQIKDSYIPLAIIGTDYIIGFNEDTKKEILNMISAYSKKDYCDVVEYIIENKDIESCVNINKGIYNISDLKSISIFGHDFNFNAKKVSLPLISIVIGFVDGFNPCAMWVLIFLISMLFNMKNKTKMWILGITFLVSSAVVYLIFMLGIFKIASSSIGEYFRYIIAVVALTFGLLNLNNFRKSLKKDAGCTVTNTAQKKKIMSRIKSIVLENHFMLSLLGIILLAISVNIIELACSAGLPAMFTTIISLNNVSNFESFIYMALYILMFMIDDIVIFIIAMVTLKITGISNKYTKYSHLIGGIIMLIIGLLMIFKMDWLKFNF